MCSCAGAADWNSTPSKLAVTAASALPSRLPAATSIPFNVDPYDIDFYDALYPLSDLDYPDMDAIAAADDRMAEAADDRMVAAAMCR